jgi:hypothetical protein
MEVSGSPPKVIEEGDDIDDASTQNENEIIAWWEVLRQV